MHERTEHTSYTRAVMEYDTMAKQMSTENEENELPASSQSSDASTQVTNDMVVKKKAPGTISFQVEYRFMLLQHWSLYESM